MGDPGWGRRSAEGVITGSGGDEEEGLGAQATSNIARIATTVNQVNVGFCICCLLKLSTSDVGALPCPQPISGVHHKAMLASLVYR